MDYHFRRLQGCGVDILENVVGGSLTSFKSGGRVSRVLMPSDVEGLIEIIYTLVSIGEPYKILGNGTNVLISDNGYNGTIISLKRIKTLRVEDNYIYSSSGINISTISLIARDNGLTGLEYAIGIPASLGGAVTMNAGAYGTETGDKVIYIEVLNGTSVEKWKQNVLDFGYRSSAIKKNKLIVLGALLNLDYGDKDEIIGAISEYTKRRQVAQPLEASAGSTFKRVNDRSAAYYIEQVGLKGARIGRAEVSKRHANFIINLGGASTSDYLSLADRVAEEVMNNFGIQLELEVECLGD